LIGHLKKGKIAFAKELGVSVSSLYYKKKLPNKDHTLKIRIEEAWRYHPSYGHRRLATHLKINKKRIRRVMKLFDLHPYRRRGKKPRKTTKISGIWYANLVKDTMAQYEGHIWAADFTYLSYQGKFLYVATVIDLYTRRILGWAAMRNHSTPLVLHALFMALSSCPRPFIFHSDNGSEYASKIFVHVVTDIGSRISRIVPGCPWENGYQESFYAQFKIDLGDPDRFGSLGELVYEIAKTIWYYNRERIHTALKMPPVIFAQRHQRKLVENHS
jgi:putative transposase